MRCSQSLLSDAWWYHFFEMSLDRMVGQNISHRVHLYLPWSVLFAV